MAMVAVDVKSASYFGNSVYGWKCSRSKVSNRFSITLEQVLVTNEE